MGMGRDARVGRVKRKEANLSLNALPSKRVKTGSFHITCTGKGVLDNYNNFTKSGIPARLVYFRKGEWVDFPLETTGLLKQAFQSRKLAVEVVMAGLSYLVDFLHMMRIDLRTGWQTSIAWIDVDGRCFFPRVVCERNGELSDVRIEVKPLETQLPLHTEEEKEGSSDPTGECQSGVSSESGSNEGSSHLVKLGDDEREFVAVRERFMDGMSRFASLTSVVGIYRNSHKSASGQSRLEAFKSHADEIRRKCGDKANIRYAWHGTSKRGVSGILLHGFGQPLRPKNGAAYGNGVYLAPQHCSYISAAYSDVDENGEQHVVLCRVIMGNVEQVKPGSHQFHPSTEQFDTGVDDLQNPKRYIVWSTHMNTHILPEYVVSFKVPPQLHEYWSSVRANHFTINRQRNPKHSLQDVQSSNPKSMSETDGDGRPHPGVIMEFSLPVVKQSQQSFPLLVKDSSHHMPSSAWMPFPMLFSIMEKFLSSSSIRLLKQHYANYKASKINREDLIRRLRMIAGDKVLASVIKMFEGQVPHVK